MTGELVTTEKFQDIPVRIIQTDKERVIPLNDIADGIGYDRDALQKIIRRNEAQFKPYSTTVVTEALDGRQRLVTCLTRDGITGVLMRLHTNKVKDPSRKERVEKFQHWVMDTIGKVMDGQLRQPTRDILADRLDIAELFHQKMGVNIGIARSVAIASVEDLTGEDLTWCKGLIPGNNGRHLGTYNAGKIGAKIGKTARQVNDILHELGYQTRGPRGWMLTTAGMIYGEMLPYTSQNGHSGYQPLWNEEVIEKIENYRPGLLEGQKGLLTGYLS